MAERRLQLARVQRSKASCSDEDDNSDVDGDDAADERRRQSLLVIANGPPLRPDSDATAKKTEFLQLFGLATSAVADGRS